MYLAPLNYDRYFKKVFSDERIAKRFLEDFLGVTITSLERLPEKHQVTDEASIVEFDYRCQIDGSYIVIDMQQWYKPDIVERFYLYHALNSSLQLENLPTERFVFSRKTGKSRKVRDYKELMPVLTLIWLVDDTLYFKENYVAYAMTPEMVMDFLRNEQLWHNPELKEILLERERVLEVASNKAKHLDFLSQNRLVFIIQRNIIKQLQGKQYERWFRFAEKSRNRKNVEQDFEEFRGDEIFEEMMRRLNKSGLTEDDYEYIENEDEMWAEVDRLERGYYDYGLRDGHAKGREEGIDIGITKGREEGRREAMVETISQILLLRIAVKTGHFEKALNCLPLDALKELSKIALTVETISEFETVLKEYQSTSGRM
jgi:hypothetical protein